VSVNPDTYRGTKEYFLVHSELVTAARFLGMISSIDVARLMGLTNYGGDLAGAVGQILREIAEDEVKNGRPMLSAVVVMSQSGQPTANFYGVAKDLGLLQDDSPSGQDDFWKHTREKLYETWQRSAS
jgi:hypothetical protein